MITKLVPAFHLASARFGDTVAVDDDVIVVGAHNYKSAGITESGAAFVFQRVNNTWTESATLTAPDPAATDKFGASVAVNGTLVVVGATQTDEPLFSDAGSAFVFQTTNGGATWSQLTKLIAPDPAADDHFGKSAAVSDNTVVVGAWTSDVRDAGPGGVDAGSAYVFDLNGDAQGDDIVGIVVGSIVGVIVVIGGLVWRKWSVIAKALTWTRQSAPLL
jgi:hypothetical protein